MPPASRIHSFFCCLLFLVVLTVSPIPAAARAEQPLERSAAYSCVGPDDHCAFLPAVLKLVPYPYLIAPANQAQLDTLIPIFSWDLGPQPENTSGCFAIGTSPDPTQCQMSYSKYSTSTTYTYVFPYNLQPNTRYYWRVGVRVESDPIKWSDLFAFTTGPAGGIVPSIPVLVSPANNSTIATGDLTMTWQPVDGAVAYSVLLHSLSTDRWFGFGDTAEPLKVVFNFASFVSSNGLGTEFEWSVQARNGYAWSNASNRWKFTYSYSGSSLRAPALREMESIMIDGKEIFRIEP